MTIVGPFGQWGWYCLPVLRCTHLNLSSTSPHSAHTFPVKRCFWGPVMRFSLLSRGFLLCALVNDYRIRATSRNHPTTRQLRRVNLVCRALENCNEFSNL